MGWASYLTLPIKEAHPPPKETFWEKHVDLQLNVWKPYYKYRFGTGNSGYFSAELSAHFFCGSRTVALRGSCAIFWGGRSKDTLCCRAVQGYSAILGRTPHSLEVGTLGLSGTLCQNSLERLGITLWGFFGAGAGKGALHKRTPTS